MKFKIETTVSTTVETTVSTKDLIVSMGNMRDTDSKSFDIYTKDYEVLIATGSLNLKSNWAHVCMEVEDDNGELEDYLVEAIEEKTINFA